MPVDEFVKNDDGTYTRVLEGGWHYSTTLLDDGSEAPDRKLHLNDSGPESDWFYEYAEGNHRSWVDKHGVGRPVALTPLVGEHPPEAFSDHPNHASYRKFHLGEDG